MEKHNNIFFSDSPINQKLSKYFLSKRIPIQCTIFLTNYCNFKCKHCYVKSLKNVVDDALNLEQWYQILDNIKNNGCVFLTVTGGEALCSPIFSKFYEYAYNINLKIIIMSNLYLINDKIIDLFRKKPPYKIIGSLYGASNDTYKKFCSIDHGWDKVSRNVQLLQNSNIPIELQTVLNIYNINELEEMYRFSLIKKIKFHAYRKISCEITGNSEPLNLNIDFEQEARSYTILNDISNLIQSIENNRFLWKDGYKMCAAGLTSCYIDYQGNIILCSHCMDQKFNILKLGFSECWNRIYEVRKKEIEVINRCGSCKNRHVCGKCNPIFKSRLKGNDFPFLECTNVENYKLIMNIE